jgi:hypothetical protein
MRQNGAHVLVGTPGRLDDIMTRCAALSVRRLELLAQARTQLLRADSKHLCACPAG